MSIRASTLALAMLTPLYGGPALADNTSPSHLFGEARAEFDALIPEEMKARFVLHTEPRPLREKTVTDGDGETFGMRDFGGEVTLVNFWATWCGPCVAEMPSLNTLQAELGNEGLKIAAITVDRMSYARAVSTLEQKVVQIDGSVDQLAFYHDPKSDLAREMGVLGIPVTAILGPDGREIGRLEGDADWGSKETVRWLRALIEAVATERAI